MRKKTQQPEPTEVGKKIAKERGGELRCARERCGLWQQELAAKLGLSKTAMSAVERGDRILTDPLWQQAWRVLGVPTAVDQLTMDERRWLEIFRTWSVDKQRNWLRLLG